MRRRTGWIIAGAIVAMSCATPKPGGSGLGAAYTYSVTGTGKASITYTDNGGNTGQATAALPWTKTVNDITFAYVSAQTQSEGGTVTCSIADTTGKVLSTQTSKGDFVIATCK